MSYTIEDIIHHLNARFSGQRVAVCEVAAQMPSSVRARYCHLRIYREGAVEPRGHALRELTEDIDYLAYERIPHGGKTLRSQYRRIHAAAEQHNEGV